MSLTLETSPMNRFCFHFAILLCGWLVLTTGQTIAQDQASEEPLPLVVEDEFEENRQQWEMLDSDSWEFAVVDGRSVLSLFRKESSYKPPHRSPTHLAILKEPAVGDFDLTVSVRSTEPDYGHRDVCIFFGYVDPAHFYYAHLGKETDPNANQIFIVNGADRTKISLTTNDGTPWDDEWRRVKVTRRTGTGRIEVYFDDFENPVMTAEDKTFPVGRVGLGSFDDRADWDHFELRGEVRPLEPSSRPRTDRD